MYLVQAVADLVHSGLFALSVKYQIQIETNFLEDPWLRGSFLLPPTVLAFNFNEKRLGYSRNLPVVVSDQLQTVYIS